MENILTASFFSVHFQANKNKMFHKSGIFFWAILITFNSGITIVLTANVAYPDSYEMYAYKQPRTMNDLKNQHMRQAMIDVKETINEVQKILQKDPKLPRLTRGEIEDLFEMVCKTNWWSIAKFGKKLAKKHIKTSSNQLQSLKFD